MDHLSELASALGSLLSHGLRSDVTLTVGKDRFPAHKLVLAARSEYFRALLEGGLRESDAAEVVLDVSSVAAGRRLLKYLYTGRFQLKNEQEQQEEEGEEVEILLDLLEAAHKFNIVTLLEHVADTLGATVSMKHAVQTFRTARLLELRALEERVLHFMDTHASQLLKHPSFLELTQAELCVILPRESFYAMETEILQGIMSWLDAFSAAQQNRRSAEEKAQLDQETQVQNEQKRESDTTDSAPVPGNQPIGDEEPPTTEGEVSAESPSATGEQDEVIQEPSSEDTEPATDTKKDVGDELQDAADALLRHVRLKFISFEEALNLLGEPHRLLFVRHRSKEPSIATPRVETTHSTNLGSYSYSNSQYALDDYNDSNNAWYLSSNIWMPSTPSVADGKLLRFKLKPQRLINEVYLELTSKDTEFYVQTSLNRDHCERVCGTCRGGGAQVIKFLPRVVKFLQIYVENGGVRSDTFRLVHR